MRGGRHQWRDPSLGKPLGVATHVNETVVGIIRARERRMLASLIAE
jgi:hypothetical protein